MSAEVIAWAIVGRATGRVRQVTLDEDAVAELKDHYDIWPLVRAEEVTDAGRI